MKKVTICIFILFVAMGFACAAPAGYTEHITQDAIVNGSAQFNHNVTWNSTNGSAVFSGNKSYLRINSPLSNAGIGTGFSIRIEAKISSDNNDSGTYTRLSGSTVAKNGWQRLFDLTDGSTYNMFFVNAGSAGHLLVGVHDKVEGKNEDVYAGFSKTTTTDYYDDWHVFELVMAPGGYGTFYVDNNPFSWYTPSDTNDHVINVIKKLSTFDTCLIGTSLYEANEKDGAFDGFFIGEIKSIGTASKAMRPLYNGTSYFYTIGFESNGGTAFDGISGTAIPSNLPIPTRTGYFFEGWFTDSAFKHKATEGTELSGNITLYAKWRSHQHEWTYISTGKEISAYCTNPVAVDECEHYGTQNRISLSLDLVYTYDLKASVLPSNATVKVLNWVSSDNTVAVVDNTGHVIGLSAGEVEITAKAVDGSGVVSNTVTCSLTIAD